ncbi:hypothetical protein DV515_00003879 [Chloebia gouldiae]|uniref:Small monomeric GTPase n=1 Tax=Chloebia gouldiae TaxID=44316 RepID=A0A3L8SSF0_CHLGU|nr:hypothetical protein DV515_00003879 [Chloebia gouldiae]
MPLARSSQTEQARPVLPSSGCQRPPAQSRSAAQGELAAGALGSDPATAGTALARPRCPHPQRGSGVVVQDKTGCRLDWLPQSVFVSNGMAIKQNHIIPPHLKNCPFLGEPVLPHTTGVVGVQHLAGQSSKYQVESPGAGRSEISSEISSCSKESIEPGISPILIRKEIAQDTKYEKVPVILVGNKVDLESEREVSLSEGRALAEEWGCPFMETSAKSKTMVDELFAEICAIKALELQDQIMLNTCSAWRGHHRGCFQISWANQASVISEAAVLPPCERGMACASPDQLCVSMAPATSATGFLDQKS